MSARISGLRSERTRIEGANRSTDQQMPFRAYRWGMSDVSQRPEVPPTRRARGPVRIAVVDEREPVQPG